MQTKKSFNDKWTEKRKKRPIPFILKNTLLFSSILASVLLLINVIGSFIFNSPYMSKAFYIQEVKSFYIYVCFLFIVHLLAWYINDYRYKSRIT